MAESEKFTYDSGVLAETSNLKIRAKNLVEGFLSGQHRSRHKGSSVEFAEFKTYSPGDDIRHIDWKVAGKTDEYFVKQFEQSTNLRFTIMLDASGSMRYESPFQKPGELTKMEYAQTLVAALAYLILKQFDGVGLILFNDKVVNRIPARFKHSHFQHILHGLGTFAPQGGTRIGEVITQIIESLPGGGLIILVSDLLAKEDDLHKTLKLVSARGMETIVFHILHPDELRFPFDGNIVFESLEDDPSIGLDPKNIREAYRQIIRNQIRTYGKTLPSLGVDYLFMETSTPLGGALNYYLRKRKSLSKE